MAIAFSFIAVILLIFLDAKMIIPLTGKYLASLFLTVTPHIIFIYYYSYAIMPDTSTIGVLSALTLFILYYFIKINIRPYPNKKSSSFRLSALIGGKRLTEYSIVALMSAFAFYITAFFCGFFKCFAPPEIIIADILFCFLYLTVISFNGCLRIAAASRRLTPFRRFILIFNLPAPYLNFPLWHYMCKEARDEFEYELCGKKRTEPPVSNMCATKYPILLVHGVGFRDRPERNYWGRIPRKLEAHGAKIFYGNQDAIAPYNVNAEFLRTRIEAILNETGAEKVNIIAHSKGGLDSRYMISKLLMSEKVASLTTISTPHRGCKYADVLFKMTPDFFWRILARIFNAHFSKKGDISPDFYTVMHQFTSSYLKEFNDNVKNNIDVYYQSYTSVMKNNLSDTRYFFTYPFIRLIDGKNDGLVPLRSAKWGEFQGIFKGKHIRGISHTDMTDLKREDIVGFDVKEKFMEIVADLKNKGY